jgi:hypothetical protein
MKVWKVVVAHRPQWGRWVVAQLVVVLAAASLTALVVPFASGAVARVGGESVASECQSGHACGGMPVAALCQSGFACGGMPPNASAPNVSAVAVWPMPGTNAVCQSGAACGG